MKHSTLAKDLLSDEFFTLMCQAASMGSSNLVGDGHGRLSKFLLTTDVFEMEDVDKNFGQWGGSYVVLSKDGVYLAYDMGQYPEFFSHGRICGTIGKEGGYVIAEEGWRSAGFEKALLEAMLKVGTNNVIVQIPYVDSIKG